MLCNSFFDIISLGDIMRRTVLVIIILLMCSGCYFVKDKDKVVKKDKETLLFTEKELEKIEEELEYDYVVMDDVDIEMTGKIIYMEIEYRDSVNREEAMEDCRDYITYFDSKKLDNYDLNMILDGERWKVLVNYSNDTFTFSVE